MIETPEWTVIDAISGTTNTLNLGANLSDRYWSEVVLPAHGPPVTANKKILCSDFSLFMIFVGLCLAISMKFLWACLSPGGGTVMDLESFSCGISEELFLIAPLVGVGRSSEFFRGATASGLAF